MMVDDDETDSLAGISHDPSVVIATMINFDFSFIINTWFGRVKVLQLIFCLLAGCILPSSIPSYYTRFSFFTFVIWTCFMYILVDLLVHVTSISKMLPACCDTTDIMMYPLLIGAFTLLIGCSLVASVADLYQSYYQYKSSNRTTRTAFACAFGFILMLLFLAEAFLYYRRNRVSAGAAAGDQSAGNRRTRSDDDFENGSLRGGRSIVISRPVIPPVADDNPPPYHPQMMNNEGKGGGTAQPIGFYGGEPVDY